MRVTQDDHRKDGRVTLTFQPELARRDPHVKIRGTISLEGKIVARIENQEIDHPGAPPLVAQWPWRTAALSDRAGGRRSRRIVESDNGRNAIGLRTLQLDRHADKAGETFPV